jgi:hypothetical protein
MLPTVSSEPRTRNGIALFDVPEGAVRFGPEDVEKALNQDLDALASQLMNDFRGEPA